MRPPGAPAPPTALIHLASGRSTEIRSKMARPDGGCCRLAASRHALGSLWAVFGSDRFPCCLGGNRTPPQAALVRPRSPMQLKLLAGIRTVIIAGDSVARQLTMALLCAIEEANNGIWPQLNVDVRSTPWLRRASLVARYTEVNVTIALLGGAALDQLVLAAARAPRPTRILLMGGGLPGLGHHWYDAVEPGSGQPRCHDAVRAAADGKPSSVPGPSLGCYVWYETTASAVLHSLVHAVDGCRQCLHVLSTTPQHHATVDGEWHSAARSTNLSTAYDSTFRGDLRCVPHLRPSFKLDHWRNGVLRRLALLSGSHFHDSFQAMGSMWDAHREQVGHGERVHGDIDCLHWVCVSAPRSCSFSSRAQFHPLASPLLFAALGPAHCLLSASYAPHAGLCRVLCTVHPRVCVGAHPPPSGSGDYLHPRVSHWVRREQPAVQCAKQMSIARNRLVNDL